MSYQKKLIPIGTLANANYTSAWEEIQRPLMVNGNINIRFKMNGSNTADATATLWESNDGGTTEYQNANADLAFTADGEYKMEVLAATGTHYKIKYVKGTNNAGTIQAIVNFS